MAESTGPPLPAGKYISANGLDIFFREWGAGKPLVLLHPATVSHQCWIPFIPALSEKYRVIAPDNRGHGRTINPEPVLTYQMMADDLAGLINALDLEFPAIFGYSDGGQAALDLGIRYPELAGVLMLGGVWFKFTQYYQDAISSGGFVSPGEMDFEIYQKQAPQDWEERLRTEHHDPRPDYPRILLSSLAKLWWTPLNYSNEDLQRISAAVLVMIGEKDEAISVEEAWELADKIHDAEFVLIPDQGHAEVISRGGFVDPVLDFLDRQAA